MKKLSRREWEKPWLPGSVKRENGQLGRMEKMVERKKKMGKKKGKWSVRKRGASLGKLLIWEMVWDWRRLSHSLTDHNDDSKLEQPEAWDPIDSSRSLPLGEGEETRHSFPYENQNAKE